MKNCRKFRRGTKLKSEVSKKWSMKQGSRTLQFNLHRKGRRSSEKCWIGGKAPKIQWSNCTPWWNFTDNPDSNLVFTELGSTAFQMTATVIMDIISRLLGCDAQAANKVSVYSQVQNGRCSQIILSSKIGVSRHLDSSTTTQMAKITVQCGKPSRSSWKESVWIFWQDYHGKSNLRKILLKHGWEKIPNWECLFVHRNNMKVAGKKWNLDPMWKMYTLSALKDNVK